jgi:hypothetical protein
MDDHGWSVGKDWEGGLFAGKYLGINLGRKIIRKEASRKTYNPSAMHTGSSQHLQHTRQDVKWKLD